MFRIIFELLLTVVVITVLKSIVGIVLRGLSDTFRRPPDSPGAQRIPNQVPLSGELKKDPVCGMYIAAATSVKKTVGGQTVHFCSQDCRNKYVATMAR
jgi:YHS domain-containing protein